MAGPLDAEAKAIHAALDADFFCGCAQRLTGAIDVVGARRSGGHIASVVVVIAIVIAVVVVVIVVVVIGAASRRRRGSCLLRLLKLQL